MAVREGAVTGCCGKGKDREISRWQGGWARRGAVVMEGNVEGRPLCRYQVRTGRAKEMAVRVGEEKGREDGEREYGWRHLPRRETSDVRRRSTERYSDFTRDHELTAKIQTVSRRSLAAACLVSTSLEDRGKRQAAAGGGCNHRTWSRRGASSHGRKEDACGACTASTDSFPLYRGLCFSRALLACTQQVEEEYPSLLLMSSSSSSLQHI